MASKLLYETGGSQTHDDRRRHSILMDEKTCSPIGKRESRNQPEHAGLHTYMLCDKERSTSQGKFQATSLSRRKNKKIDFKILSYRKLGMIEMQSMIIFSSSATVDKSNRGAERDKTESKHKTPHFEMPPRDSLKQSRSRGWCWFRRRRFFMGRRLEAPPPSECHWIQRDQSCAIPKY
jgi:hypothetical protein